MEARFSKKKIREKDQTSDMLYNSIISINFTINGKKIIGGGFLIKFNLKNKLRYFFITYYHLITEEYVNKKMAITLCFGKLNEHKKLIIILDRNERYIKCFDKSFNVTIVEIIEKDNIKKENCLGPDFNYKNGYLYYNNKSYYIVSYNQNNINEKEIKVSSGKITKILNESEFEYSLDTECCNAGSLIFLLNNCLVIGIHKQRNIIKSKNHGIFLGYILDNIEKEEAIKNKNELDNEIKEYGEVKNENIKLIEEGKNEKENIKGKYLSKKVQDKYSNNDELFKKIKSKYIINMILSNLNEKIKLEIIKYNKRIQNIININLSIYKFFSGRYIEYETNIKGKEYNGYTDNVIYEGGLLKGKRNGKGKEYNEYNTLIYEGEYLNGKRNGKGKEYYDNGKLEFEGEYLNGEKNGKGKEYKYFGKLEFEGEYLNGERNGKGKEYYDNGKLKFEGEYLNGEKNGKGKEYYYNGE